MKRIGFAVAAIAAVLARTGFAQQACVAADSACKESFAVGQFSFWYYRSFPLQTPNPNITRAVIVMQGMNRNASDSFQAVVTALNNAGDPTLLVIAPHFKGFDGNSPSCNDNLEPNELHWSCSGQGSINRWDDGGQALDAGGDVIYSFAMIDKLLDTLNDASLFPNLRKITITGYSEGGQFTQRYAVGNLKDGAISPSVKYVIANPSSYMYLDNNRLPKGETCLEDGTCTAPFTANWDPGAACPDSYNRYQYGPDGRSYGYMSSNQPGLTDGEVRARFLSRTVALLTGENDQSDDQLFDTSCPATAQGGHLAGDGSGLVGGRRERGIIFWNYTRQLGAAHALTLVPRCGHDEKCMYSAAETIQAITGGGSSRIAPTPSELSAWSAAGAYTTGTVGLLHVMAYNVRDNTTGGTVTNASKIDGFSANFNRLSGANVTRSLSTAPTAGQCTVLSTLNPSPPGTASNITIGYLDAGPSINSSGPNGTQVAVKTVLPSQLVYVANNVSSITPGRYRFSGQGGPDVGAFSGTLDLAPELVWTNPDDAKVVSRANGLLVKWSGGDPNELVTITGQSSTSVTNSGSFLCWANNSAGQFTVPGSILNQLPASTVVTSGAASTVTRGRVGIFTMSQTRLTAPGVDYLIGSGEWSTTLSAQYK